ncbi:hypothetical protein [Helicobacter sp. 12S02634-8]|nr:hypothetical protein [Helicobacter sp. 12S02634-8]
MIQSEVFYPCLSVFAFAFLPLSVAGVRGSLRGNFDPPTQTADFAI